MPWWGYACFAYAGGVLLVIYWGVWLHTYSDRGGMPLWRWLSRERVE